MAKNKGTENTQPAAVGAGSEVTGQETPAAAEAHTQEQTNKTQQEQAATTAAPAEDGSPAQNEKVTGDEDAKAKADAEAAKAQAVKTTTVMLHHKTQFPRDRCCGLVLTQKVKSYEVSDEQLAKLKRDPWVIIGGAVKK
jgi:hypothetical protein